MHAGLSRRQRGAVLSLSAWAPMPWRGHEGSMPSGNLCGNSRVCGLRVMCAVFLLGGEVDFLLVRRLSR